MPKKLAETTGFQVTVSQSLYELLEQLTKTGAYGSQITDAVEQILGQEVRRLIATGEFDRLAGRFKVYPPKEKDNAEK